MGKEDRKKGRLLKDKRRGKVKNRKLEEEGMEMNGGGGGGG